MVCDETGTVTAASVTGMGRARYRGRRRVAIRVLLTFIVCNVKKTAMRLALD